VEVPLEDTVVDHKHKASSALPGPNGDGLIRGVIHRGANALEGKIVNNFARVGLKGIISIPEYLRALADYLENPPIKQVFIHPSEKPKTKKLGKRDYKKIVKFLLVTKPRSAPPEYPKSGKMSAKWEILLLQANDHFQKK